MTGSSSNTLPSTTHIVEQSQPDTLKFSKLMKDAESSDPQLALELYDQAIEIKPDYAPAYFNKAFVLYKTKAYQEAIVAIQKGLKLDNNNTKSLLMLANCLYKIGDQEGCIRLCERIVKIEPNNVKGYLTLGKKLMRVGRFQLALEAFNKVIELDPKNMKAQGNKGCVLYMMNKDNITEVVNHYDKQLEMDPLNFKAHIKKGKLLEDAGKKEEALDCFNKASEIIPEGVVLDRTWSKGDTEINLNPDEVGLVNYVKDLKRISSSVVAEEYKVQEKELSNLKESLKLKIIRLFGKRRTNTQVLSEVQKELEELKQKYYYLEAVVQDAGVTDLADIKRGFKELEEKDIELYTYCKTFYWTMINVFQAYKLMSTGLLQVNFEKIEVDDHFCTNLKKATSICSSITQGVPIIGTALCKILNIVDEISRLKKKQQIEALIKVIMFKFNTEDELSIKICKAALAFTQAKKKKILYPELFKKPEASKNGFKWLEGTICDIKERVLECVGVYNNDSYGSALALQDVTLVVSYLCNNAEAVIKRKDTLEKQIASIIKLDGFDLMLEGHELSAPKEKKRDCCSFCGIF